MGEVYQAYDERLDRWVAIKLIRPDRPASETARERFRREARAAARLSHPSIVQIHDIVESEEGDAIVMELVEGESLAKRIARGPLPVPTRRCGSGARSPRGWRPRTRTGSSTAISSPRTS